MRSLTELVLQVVEDGTGRRSGPLPAGGPAHVADAVRRACCPVLPETGRGAEEAIGQVVGALVTGAADPAHPWCAAHLHCPPLAVAAAADLATAMLNPSMDSWDQAPAASALEAEVTAVMARLVYPEAVRPDAVVTSGATASNLLGLLLARERARAGGGGLRLVCGANAHHSVARAAWTLGLPPPVLVHCDGGRMSVRALDEVLGTADGPALVVATAGTTDAGALDPLGEIADVASRYGADLHVDAAYGGALLFSERLRPLLVGLSRATTVALDLHKFGWQPVAAGVFVVADATVLAPLATRADYLNAADDAEAGIPDLLARSLHTSRRADVVKVAVTLRALGRDGLAAMVEACCATATGVARRMAERGDLRVWAEPELATVLFRPVAADGLATGADDAGDALVADVRRSLLAEGTAVVGRARVRDSDGTERLWLKLTLLHPHARPADYDGLLEHVCSTARCCHRRASGADG